LQEKETREIHEQEKLRDLAKKYENVKYQLDLSRIEVESLNEKF